MSIAPRKGVNIPLLLLPHYPKLYTVVDIFSDKVPRKDWHG